MIRPWIKNNDYFDKISLGDAQLDLVSKLKSIKYLHGKNSIGFLVTQKLTNEVLQSIKSFSQLLDTSWIGSLNVKPEELKSTTKFEEMYNAELIIALGNLYENFVPMAVKIKNIGKPFITLSDKGTKLDEFANKAYVQQNVVVFLKQVLKALVDSPYVNENAENYAKIQARTQDILVSEEAREIAEQ